MKIQRPAKPTDGSFSVLRAAIRERAISVWIDGEQACDDIPLDAPLGVSAISLAGMSNGRSLFNCEFDSFRIWRSGEGPPLSAAIRTER